MKQANDIIEQVARAICRVSVTEEGHGVWHSMDFEVNERWVGYVPDAKAAIQALIDVEQKPDGISVAEWLTYKSVLTQILEDSK